MQLQLERVVSASEAAEVEVFFDRRPQDNSNDVVLGELQALTDAVNRLLEVAEAQPEGPLNLSARNWQRVKYLAAGGLAVYAFTADTFQIIGFIQSVVTGSLFLQAIERLVSTTQTIQPRRIGRR